MLLVFGFMVGDVCIFIRHRSFTHLTRRKTEKSLDNKLIHNESVSNFCFKQTTIYHFCH